MCESLYCSEHYADSDKFGQERRECYFCRSARTTEYFLIFIKKELGLLRKALEPQDKSN